MTRRHIKWLAAPAILALGACTLNTAPPSETTYVVQPQTQTAPIIAPSPPPPPHAELVPPPPAAGTPEVWQPGHWAYTGSPSSPWTWVNGQYVPAPPGAQTWVPGHWTQQPSGGWMWMEGHWA
ncbi:MAG: YXWGXW repeat-containing protein [Acetobacteraceae bacterium]|nr:YXWGXW repeat-containing protein [Acetobacteraceae bacterium]